MNSFILASGNKHKAFELADHFSGINFQIEPAPEKLDVVEDGSSFIENAEKKARAYFEKFKLPTISDDSGLVVEALPGELGIHSARFGGDGLTDEERAKLLLKKLDQLGDVDRHAYFVCVLCFFLSPAEIYFFEGRLKGTISRDYRGDAGFGYDPVFCPLKLPEKTLAEIPEWKAENSHRAKSCTEAISFFRSQ